MDLNLQFPIGLCGMHRGNFIILNCIRLQNPKSNLNVCSKIENKKLTKIVTAVHLRCMYPAISLLPALKKYHKKCKTELFTGVNGC